MSLTLIQIYLIPKSRKKISGKFLIHRFLDFLASMAESVDAPDLKSVEDYPRGVQVSLLALS